MKRMKVIISSMTKEERQDYKLIKESRLKRIAKGSGSTEEAVKDFLGKFRQMEQMMGGLSAMMNGGGFPGMPGMPGKKGFRQDPNAMNPFAMGQQGQKDKKKSGKGPWGKGYF